MITDQGKILRRFPPISITQEYSKLQSPHLVCVLGMEILSNTYLSILSALALHLHYIVKAITENMLRWFTPVSITEDMTVNCGAAPSYV